MESKPAITQMCAPVLGLFLGCLFLRPRWLLTPPLIGS
jgi:hypothetical protein